jgi:hypothetical protein
MSDYDKANYQVALAFTQRFAGDTAGAKLTAEQARNTLELPHRGPPDNRLRAVLRTIAGEDPKAEISGARRPNPLLVRNRKKAARGQKKRRR